MSFTELIGRLTSQNKSLNNRSTEFINKHLAQLLS